MIDHSLVTGFTMFIRRSFDMTCFGISTYHRHEPPLFRSHPFIAHSDHRGARDPVDFSVPVAYHSIVVVLLVSPSLRSRGLFPPQANCPLCVLCLITLDYG
jgi:hypothetical protein